MSQGREASSARPGKSDRCGRGDEKDPADDGTVMIYNEYHKPIEIQNEFKETSNYSNQKRYFMHKTSLKN